MLNRNQTPNCSQVNALLGAYLEDGLPQEQAGAVRAHLDACLACRGIARRDAKLARQLQRESAWRRRRLSPRAAARVQDGVYRRIRRKLIMQRTMQFAGATAGLAVLALVVGAFVFAGLWGQLGTHKTHDGYSITVVTPDLTRPTAVAPGTDPAHEPLSDEDVSLTFVVPQYIGIEVDVYRAMAGRFHELHPEITIEVKEWAWTEETEQLTLRRHAEQGDCFLTLRAPLQEETSAILGLDALIEADPTFSMDDLYPKFLARFSAGGQLWALPAEGVPLVMYYNKDLFDAAGLAYPSLDWTLDEFLALSIALTQVAGPDKQYGYVPNIENDWEDFYLFTKPLFFIEQQGARLMDVSSDPIAYTFDSLAVAEALQWYANLSYVYGAIAPTSSTRSYILAERGGMWLSYFDNHRFATWQALFNLGVAPVPQGPGRVNSFTMLGYGIAAHTEHPEICWEWLKFLSEQVEAIQGMPARRSVAESDAFRQWVGPELADVFLVSLERWDRELTEGFDNDWWSRNGFIVDQFIAALDAATQGEGAQAALSAAQRKVDVYAHCLETTSAYENEQDLVAACAAQAQAVEP